MMMVAVAAGVGFAVVASFAAGAVVALFVAGKMPERNKPAVVEKTEETRKMPLPQQFENLMNYNGGLTSADRE